MKSRNTSRSAIWLTVIFALIFLFITGRFLYLQTTGEVQGVDLNEWADKARTSSYEIDATRGKIYDKNGMVLAYDRPTYRMQAIVDPEYSRDPDEPNHVKDIDQTAEELASILDTTAGELEQKMKSGKENGQFQVEFGSTGRNLSQDVMKDIKAKELPGITFSQEAKRYYPNGTFASHLLGFARNNGGKIEGVSGVEQQMEKHLKETKGQISYQRDKYGSKLLNPEETIQKPDDGENVHLTIDQKIQTFLEDAMTQVNEEYNPESITAGVMNPDTGEVLAMSNRPSYNPNNIGDIENWYNNVVSNTFEPGSTMKMFTWASAIEEGVYNGDELFESGSYKYDDNLRPIYDHKPEGWGQIDFDTGFQYSSNVAAMKLVNEKLGTETFRGYLNDFNFGKKTGIDLPNEASGNILYNYLSEKMTTSFGQGTTVTPIQLMTAATSIANDGDMMKPYVLSKVTSSENGEMISENKPEKISSPISEDTAKKMRELMGKVVTAEDATGTMYKLNDYALAGKTGTSQLPDSDSGGYMSGRENYRFSFMGMAPKEDPELLMYVSVKQPELENTETGAAPVSYIVKTVMENSLHYLNIKPQEEKAEPDVSTVTMPDVTSEDLNSAKQQLNDTFEHVTTIGDGGDVTDVYPKPGEEILPHDRVFIVTDQPTMPDVSGWSKRDIYKLGDLLDLKVETMGNGYAFKQNVVPGANLKKEDYLVVEFNEPNSSQSSDENQSSQGSENQNDASGQSGEASEQSPE
ncbi:penicillin-binding protein [Thalassobacillus sp. CUG 92003]|uniref:penicillin-binding protein n=1 Tax=Thalassobacillus sp. CUG 92003 TaxID=2736641 RepID=UPI0015E69707|nr:penicillin-binding protein [Thalassobacillus sp. CUG 92003]